MNSRGVLGEARATGNVIENGENLREKLKRYETLGGYSYEDLLRRDKEFDEQVAREDDARMEAKQERQRKEKEAKEAVEADAKVQTNAVNVQVATEETKMQAAKSMSKKLDHKDRRQKKLDVRLANERTVTTTPTPIDTDLPKSDLSNVPTPSDPSMFVAENEDDDATGEEKYPIPAWYRKIQPAGRKIQDLKKAKGPTKQILTALASMKDCINRCEITPNGAKLRRTP